MEKNYETLELDKVLEMLKNETSCDDAAEMALNTSPLRILLPCAI